MADAAGDEPHEHLAGARLGEVDLADASGAPNSSRTAALIFIGRDPTTGILLRRDGSRPRSAGTAPARAARAARGRHGGASAPSSRRSGARRSRAASATSPRATCSRRAAASTRSARRGTRATPASRSRSARPTRRSSTTAPAPSTSRARRRRGATACPTSCAASPRRATSRSPAAGTRCSATHELAVIPQTSTIASHLPRAVGVAFAIERAKKLGVECPWPSDARRRLQLRRRVAQPRDGAGGAEQRGAHRATRACRCRCSSSARTTASGSASRSPQGWVEQALRVAHAAALRVRRRRPTRSGARDGARARRLGPRAPPPGRPAPAHRALPQPRGRRRRDRLPLAAGDPRRLGRRPAARDRAPARGERRVERRAARRRLHSTPATGCARSPTRPPASRSSTRPRRSMRPLAPRTAPRRGALAGRRRERRAADARARDQRRARRRARARPARCSSSARTSPSRAASTASRAACRRASAPGASSTRCSTRRRSSGSRSAPR